jgi:hypothetical protein
MLDQITQSLNIANRYLQNEFWHACNQYSGSSEYIDGTLAHLITSRRQDPQSKPLSIFNGAFLFSEPAFHGTLSEDLAMGADSCDRKKPQDSHHIDTPVSGAASALWR